MPGRVLALVLGVLAVVLGGVAAPAYAGSPPRPMVLAISIDGLNPSAIERLGPSGAPTFYRLMSHGASTLDARTEQEQTVTLPNHASMMTGRRIDRTRGGHGVTWDDDRPGTTVQRAAGHDVASIFDVVHGAGGRTALFTTKPKFGLYQRSWAGSIDRYDVSEDHARVVAAVRADLTSAHRDLTFLHLSLPDRTGHARGFMSPAYVEAVRQTDTELAQVMQTVDADPVLHARLRIVLTADHGGLTGSREHSLASNEQNYRIPFLIWGSGLAKADLYAVNPTYADPGSAQVGYDGPQPIRNGDLADTVTRLLGLLPVPGSTIGVDRPLASVG